MGNYGLRALSYIGLLTLIEALLWCALSAVGWLVCKCAIEMPWNDLTIQYFYYGDECYGSNLNYSAKRTKFILGYYFCISLVWTTSSLSIICAACSKPSRYSFYLWFFTTILTLLSDLVVMTIHLLDLQKDTILKESVGLMAMFSVRGGIGWIMNAVIMRAGYKAYNHSGAVHGHQAATTVVQPSHSNLAFAADHIGQNGGGYENVHNNQHNHNYSLSQDDPNRRYLPTMIDRYMDELKERNGDRHGGDQLRKDFTREETWNNSPGEVTNHRGDIIRVEPPGREGSRWNFPYNSESNHRLSGYGNNNYNRPPNMNYNGMNRSQNDDSSRRNTYQNGDQWIGDRNPSNVQPGYSNAWYAHRNDDPDKRRNDSSRVNDKMYRNTPNAQTGFAPISGRTENSGGWETPRVLDPVDNPYSQGDLRITREDMLQRFDENHGRRSRGDSLDQNSRPGELKRPKVKGPPVPPKGLQNQYPWSYVLPQGDSAQALRKKPAAADDEDEEDDLPPVPVPDYTLHFKRPAERPALSRTSSTASSMPRY